MKKVVIAALCAVLSACAAAPFQVTEQNNGQTFVIPAGGRVVVRLPENPSTGYSWQFFFFPHDQNVLTGADENYVASDSPFLGAGGTKELSFTAARAGKVTVTGYYYRPWEKLNRQTDQKAVFTFDVVE